MSEIAKYITYKIGLIKAFAFSSIAAQSSSLGISRKHSSVPWQCYNPKVDICGSHCSYKSHIQNKLARDIVVRSELAGTGSTGDSYSLSGKLKNPVGSKPL